ncbi:MAG: primosomal protein N' [Hydrogenoanaerobacterium sp.]
MTRKIAKVAVDKAAFHFDKLYDYLVPQEHYGSLCAGSRVLVPFGAGNRKRQGVVLAVADATDESLCGKLKPLSVLLDEEIYLTPELLELVYYLKENTFCTFYDAVKTLLPAGVGYSLGFTYRANLQSTDCTGLTVQENEVLAYVASRKAPIAQEKLCEELGLTPQSSVLKKLMSQGLLLREESQKRNIGDETITMVRMAPQYADELPASAKLTPKQKAVTELLYNVGAASVKEIAYFTACTAAVVKALCKKGFAELYENPVLRIPKSAAADEEKNYVLTAEQQKAYLGLLQLYKSGKAAVSLLYGITGSGKTNVFLRLIKDVVACGRQVIVLVPEIALTPQTINTFMASFGGRVAILHSGLSMGERLDEWKRIRTGAVDIAVGTRSAVFAPFTKLGIIIIDEEQEGTYKSEGSPRYHAREVAKHRCKTQGAQLVLCSATPSIESFYYAKKGIYHLFTLTERFGDAVLPQVEVVDMDEEAHEGNSYSLSHTLAGAIAENLQKKQQTILLLNRRGYNTVVKCQSCNTPVVCPHCSIGLTYHSANGRLMCHYCGYSRELNEKCEVCGSKLAKYSGAGTQKLEDELKTLFPSARVLRMDADTTMAKSAYEQGFKSFAQGDYDIMVGTQMVAKGLNFKNVTLVGVLAADSTLFGDNFKSEERTFSLITQVVGRSGRGELPGAAYIQTFFPQNEVFALAAKQDYDKFYEGEILARRLMLYPPFCTMCAVGFSGENENEVRERAQSFLSELTQLAKSEYPKLAMRVLPVTPCSVVKVNGKYRYKILIKCKNCKEFRGIIARLLVSFGKAQKGRGVTAYADLYFDGSI